MTGLENFIVGVDLADGWSVTGALVKSKDATGGCFSESYTVQNTDGKKGFMKVLDLSRVKHAKDIARELQKVTEVFNYERDILGKCRRNNRVVTAISDGTVMLNGVPFGQVQYLIFELADGDVRTQSDISKRLDLAWCLRSLHHIIVGMMQLHNSNIAHQDLKPSNVLVFNGDGCKVGDLGHALEKGVVSPRGNFVVLGDPAYAPIEQLYGYEIPDWDKRRLGGDMYLIGSMIVFYFTGIGLSVQIESLLAVEHNRKNWNGDYYDVLPYLRDAFDEVIYILSENISDPIIDKNVRNEIITMVRQLCDPDPELRGHPRNIAIGNRYSLERFASRMGNIASKTEYIAVRINHGTR